MKTPIEISVMKSTTPNADPPSTQLRKTVFGSLHKLKALALVGFALIFVLQLHAQTWQQVPLRTQAQLLAGIAGGEGMQIVTCIAYAPSNPSIIYITSDTMQVYKSTDGGTTWNRCGNQGLPPNGFLSLAIDPNNPNVVLVAGSVMEDGNVGTTDGIYRTQDGGATWAFVYQTGFDRANSSGGINFAFSGSSTVYCGTQTGGLLKSINNGQTWSVLNGSTGLIRDVKLHPQQANVVFLATDSGIKKVTDNGASSTLQVVNTLLAAVVCINTTTPTTIYAASWANGFYRSTDGGANFTLSNSGLPLGSGFEANWLSMSPSNPSRLYISVGGGAGAPPYFLPYRSSDGGVTWQNSSTSDAANLTADLYDSARDAYNGTPIGIHPTNPDIALMSANILEKSTDGGINWVYSGSGHSGGRAVTFAWYPSEPNRTASFLIDFGSMMTANSGGTFKAGTPPRYNGAYTTWAGDVDPTAGSGVQVTAAGTWNSQIISVTTDYGQSWTQFPTTAADYRFIAFHRQNPNIVYADQYKSLNKGVSWTKLNGNRRVDAMFRGNGDIVYSMSVSRGTGGNLIISKSTDAGATWPTTYTDNTGYDIFYGMCVDPVNQNRLYVTASDGLHIYDGSGWTRKTDANGLALDSFGEISAYKVAIDPAHPNVVYVGKWRSYQGHSNGIFRSEDYGNSFINISGNLGPNFTVEGLSVNPSDGYVYVGSSFGTWKLAPPYTGGGGSLTGSKGASSGTYTLSTGTADWSHWGQTTATTWNHKSGITPLIGNFTKIGSGTVNRYANNPTRFSWTGGTPNNKVTATTNAVYISGVGNGFQITTPADTTTRTLKVYVGVYVATGKIEATLSDGSAPAYVDTSLVSNTGTANAVYTLTYKAASAGKTLTVKWTQNAGTGNVTWQAATRN